MSYVGMYVHMHVCAHVYLSMCVYIYIHTYILRRDLLIYFHSLKYTFEMDTCVYINIIHIIHICFNHNAV